MDIAFVELIPGVEIVYNDRHPKPKTPPPPKVPTPPPKEPTPPQPTAETTEPGATTTITNADGTVTVVQTTASGEPGAVVLGEDGKPIEGTQPPAEPEVPKGPPPPPPPFEYSKDLPPEGAEVPFVKNYVEPPPEPEPSEIPAEETAPAADGTTPQPPTEGTTEQSAATTEGKG